MYHCIFMLLFSFFIFSDLRSLKIEIFSDRRSLKTENENNNTITLTAEVTHMKLGSLESRDISKLTLDGLN